MATDPNSNSNSPSGNNGHHIKPGYGKWLITIGIAGLIATGILSCCKPETIINGSIPAMSFLIIILGMCFAFPSLLQESSSSGNGGVSTMRVVVLIVVLVFGVVYIKLGWLAGSFEDFKIDESWIYILGLAFGGKALQKFGENGSSTTTPAGGTATTPAQQQGASSAGQQVGQQ